MWEKIKLMSSSVWVFALPFLRQMMSKVGSILAASAMEAVKVAVGSNGAEKRSDAYNRIVKDLGNQGVQVGKDVGSSLVFAAIEVALQKIK